MKFGAFSSLLVTLAFVCSFGVNGEYATATDSTFESLVLEAKNPVVVLFCAVWSSLCKDSVLDLDEKVSKQPRITMVYVDIDESPEVTKKNQVRSIPTFYGFYNGKIINTNVGRMTGDISQRFVAELISKSS